jgi:membrane-bound lytic murein transglycosylase B
MFRIFLLTVILLASLNANTKVTGYYANSKDVKHFINYMIRKYNFKRSYLIDIFSQARTPKAFKYQRVKRKIQYGMIEGKNRWLQAIGYTKYESAYLNKDRVLQGLKFIKRYKTIFSKIEQKLKVNKYIIASIIGIESYYGEIKGRWEAFNVLAFYAFKKKRRAKFFRYELEYLLLLGYRQKLNILYLKGSKFGALGLGQLMPHSFIKYGLSFDGNKKIEPFSYPDAIATVANFLHKKGWNYQKPVAIRARFEGRWIDSVKSNKIYALNSLKNKGLKMPTTKATFLKVIKLKRAEFEEVWLTFKNFQVLKYYNNSNYYAMAVYQLAQEIKKRDY